MLTIILLKFILKNMKKAHKGLFSILLIFVAVVALAAGASYVYSVAYAEAHAEADTFEVIFPHDSYFQSEHPSLVAANDEYLAMYDDALSKLFVSRRHVVQLLAIA